MMIKINYLPIFLGTSITSLGIGIFIIGLLRYKLPESIRSQTIIKILIFGVIFGSILYPLLELMGSFAPSEISAKIFFILAIMTLNITTFLLILFFDIILSPSPSRVLYGIVILAILIKGVSLLIEPVKVYRIGAIWIREGVLSNLALSSASIILLLLIYELLKAIRLTLLTKKKTRTVLLVLSCIVIVFIGILIIFVLASINFIQKTMIPFTQEILTSSISLLLAFLVISRVSHILLLPIIVHGIIIMTYGGVTVYREGFTDHGKRTLPMVSSLMASIIGLTRGIEEREAENLFRVYEFVEKIITVYFGRFSVGCVYSNGSNTALRELLRTIVNEFEEKVGVLDEGIVFDTDTQIAKDVIGKYRIFFV
ncbi:MAG: hypothetical protein ACTSX9_09030 [Candidatus Njordarchaeales archaeon]